MSDASSSPAFRQPTAIERLFNRVFGFLVGMGLGFKHNYLLQVRGRKSGKLYSTPINLLEVDGRRYLVAPRGQTQWVRNAEAAGEVVLKKGSHAPILWSAPSVANGDKPPLLKAYLEKFKAEVQRYFPIAAGSDVEAFEGIAAGLSSVRAGSEEASWRQSAPEAQFWLHIRHSFASYGSKKKPDALSTWLIRRKTKSE